MKSENFKIKSELAEKVRKIVWTKKANGEKISIMKYIEDAIRAKIDSEK
jgi:hypothetical protein